MATQQQQLVFPYKYMVLPNKVLKNLCVYTFIYLIRLQETVLDQ